MLRHCRFPTIFVVGVLALTAGETFAETEEERTKHKIPEDVVRIRLVDSEQKPVAGALVYRRLRDSDQTTRLHESLGPIHTDSEGLADVPAQLLYPYGLPKPEDHPTIEVCPIYAIHETRRLVGITTVKYSDMGRITELRMFPPCVVTGEVTSTELQSLGRELPPHKVYITLDSLPYIMKMPLWVYRKQPKLEFWLPPGKYLISVFNAESYARSFNPEITSEMRGFSLGTIDLPAQTKYKLLGRPAPELREIKAWKNTEPLTLKELRGKVVLLDFWGHWCGPCIHVMPEVFSLHDQYAKQGLVVIGVHDDSVASVEELDERILAVRNSVWAGRDIPFPVGIAGGGETRIEGTDKSVAGATVADYGIVAWPTTLLIDRQGIVVHVGGNKTKSELVAAIKEQLEK